MTKNLNLDDLAPRNIPSWKRLFDLTLLMVLSPLILLFSIGISVMIKLVSRGPVFFVQERIGLRGKPFRLLKFRTMHQCSDTTLHQNHLSDLIKSNRPMQKLDNSGDRRMIPFGRLLRASGLDELPQLINVLRGEMSLIGPRPCTQYEYEMYQPWHKERLTATPGLTGLWQVSGKNKTTFEEMVNLDIRYARNPSFWIRAVLRWSNEVAAGIT